MRNKYIGRNIGFPMVEFRRSHLPCSQRTLPIDATKRAVMETMESSSQIKREYQSVVRTVSVEATRNPGTIALRISTSMKSGRRRAVLRRWVPTTLGYATTVADSVACALRTVNATRSTSEATRGNKRGCSLRDLRADPSATF